MALSVPTYTDPMQQVKPDQLPGVRVNTTANADAFGDGQSQQNLEKAEMGLGKTLTDVAQEQRNKADLVAHIQADTQASKLQTQIQMNVSKMKGQDAFGAPDYADQAWKDGVDSIRSNLTGRNQQLAFDKTSGERYNDLNKSVQMHVNTESVNFADQTIQSGSNQARDAAIQNAGDDQQVVQNVGLQKQMVDRWAELKGIPKESAIYKDKLVAEQSATHLGVVQAKLESGLDDSAKDYFQANKSGMSAHDVITATNALESSEIISRSTGVWNDIQNQKGFKFSDGSINGEAVRKYVMDKNDDMSDQKTLKVLSQVKAMAQEYNRDRYHQIAANERSFANEVVAGRQSGMTLTDALKAAPKWGMDAYDIAQKEDFIQKTYEPPAETKSIAYEQLKEGIENGTVALTDIDRAKDQRLINSGDWGNLRQKQLKTRADGTDPQMKNTMSNIKGLAVQSFGNDKQAMSDFMYVLGKKTEGKSADETYAIAQDELKKVPKPDAHWWNSNVQQFKIDAPSLRGSQTANGQILQDVGYKQTQAIAQGLGAVPQFGKDPNPAQHIQAFANTMGLKYEDLKVGQPANNAIQSLQAKGKIVTPTAVQKVLEKYPDGNWK